MADRKTIQAVEGETRFGPHDPNQKTAQGIFYIPSSNIPLKGSIFAMDGISSLGVCTTWYFFVTSAGVLKVANAIPTDTETGGAAV